MRDDVTELPAQGDAPQYSRGFFVPNGETVRELVRGLGMLVLVAKVPTILVRMLCGERTMWDPIAVTCLVVDRERHVSRVPTGYLAAQRKGQVNTDLAGRALRALTAGSAGH